ncbi:MAG: DUF2345 domain-containing protein, partial [Gammaproteobacteria bacterium]|nr:DUF2345 domain-containing protein [Gammaproteobacteria bacterium]
GAKLFAAKGKVQLQAQSDAMELIASLGIKMISTQDSVEISASKNIILTAGGSQIKIGGDGITLTSPSVMNYKASQHVFAGGAAIHAEFPQLPNTTVQKYSHRLDVYNLFVNHNFSDIEYKAVLASGNLFSGVLDEHGRTMQIPNSKADKSRILVGTQDEWGISLDVEPKSASDDN